MKLSDFLLFPAEVTSVDKNIDLVAYDSDYVEDPQVGKFLKMLVNADTENEVRAVLKLIWG